MEATIRKLRERPYVKVQESRHRIVIEPSKTDISYGLTDMLSKVTENNIHRCIETGGPIGNEIW